LQTDNEPLFALSESLDRMLHVAVAPDPDRASTEPRAPDGAIAEPAVWRRSVLELLPSLRAFAWSLSRNPADADDLVQETLTKAWTYRERFADGTNLRAWLFTILRNTWYSTTVKRAREVADEDGKHAAGLTAEAAQDWSAELTALRAALNRLPPEHREAVVMVGAAGLSYEEAAAIAGCALGTIKSRVNRARNRLAELMDMDRAA
jgi:RNA polymerase sigma-70 factor, ECF subfamily